MGDERAAGAESTLVGFELWPTQHGALLLLGTSLGVHAFAIDSNGNRIPVASTITGAAK